MGKIFATSDLHFGHDREFVWKVRGYNSVEDMNEQQIAKWNSVVGVDDDVYVLGDLMLGSNTAGLACIARLNGRIHIVLGNHDTSAREALYRDLYNVVEVAQAIKIKFNKHHFFMSHYPAMTGNLENENLKQMTLNLFGHTHQTKNFYEDRPYMYHVGVDSHDGYPVNLYDVLDEMYAKVEECLNSLEDSRCEECKLAPACATHNDRNNSCPDFMGGPNKIFLDETSVESVDQSRCSKYKKDPPDGGYYG